MVRVLLMFSFVGLAALPYQAAHPRPSPSATRPADQSLAIIVNQSNSVEDLSLPELRKLFLGERSHWPNGRRITLVMMEPGQPERKTVLRDICHLSEHDFGRHFLQGLFTGEVFASPKTLASPVGCTDSCSMCPAPSAAWVPPMQKRR